MEQWFTNLRVLTTKVLKIDPRNIFNLFIFKHLHKLRLQSILKYNRKCYFKFMGKLWDEKVFYRIIFDNIETEQFKEFQFILFNVSKLIKRGITFVVMY